MIDQAVQTPQIKLPETFLDGNASLYRILLGLAGEARGLMDALGLPREGLLTRIEMT